MPAATEIDRLKLMYELTGDVGEVNVFDLAPALLGLGSMLQEANRVLGNQSEISVNVRPFAPGSFIADIVLYAQTNYPLLVPAAAAINDFRSVLEAIGFIKGKTISVIEALRKLGAKPAKVEALGPNQFRYSADNNNSVTVDGNVGTLMQNPVIHNHFYPVLGRPVEKESVTALETYLRDAREQTKVEISKQDAPIFREYSESATPRAEEVREIKHTTEYYLQPKRISVEGEPDNWSFRYGSEKDILKIDAVRDQDFLDKVKRGVYKLTKDDLLIADVLTTQMVIGKHIAGSKSELMKVKHYEPATRPSGLIQ